MTVREFRKVLKQYDDDLVVAPTYETIYGVIRPESFTMREEHGRPSRRLLIIDVEKP